MVVRLHTVYFFMAYSLYNFFNIINTLKKNFFQLRSLKQFMDKLPAEVIERNKPSQEILFAHVDDLGDLVPSKSDDEKEKAEKSGEKKQKDGEEKEEEELTKVLLEDDMMYGELENLKLRNGVIESNIEGLPDVEKSDCLQAKYVLPEDIPHSCELLGVKKYIFCFFLFVNLFFFCFLNGVKWPILNYFERKRKKLDLKCVFFEKVACPAR